MAARLRLSIAALALAFLVVHVQSLPRSLEDIDTINFALGVESFDVAAHRPHPPGYPVFIAAGKLSTSAFRAIAPSWDRNHRAAVGLAIWGVLAGTLLAWILVRFWMTLGCAPITAWFGALLTIAAPVFWFTAARPLSDATALVAAAAVQWRLVRAGLEPSPVAARWRAVLPAFFAGLLIGLRTQTLWLTGPLVAWITVQRMWRREWTGAVSLVAASAVGALVWAVPLVWTTGGLDAYLSVLRQQGQDDFLAVRMLATSPDVRVFSERLAATFIEPWRIEWLGQLLSLLALVGLVRLTRRNGRATLALAIAFVPYLVFHLLFHEIELVRYAMPVVVPMGGLAAVALWMLPPRAALTSAIVLAAVCLIAGHAVLWPYGRDVPPTFQAFDDAKRAASAAADEPLVITHDGMRRVGDWFRPEWPSLPVMQPYERRWLRIVDHFRSGADDRAWFLSDPRRNDIASFDPRSRRVVREYRRNPAVRQLVGRIRQDDVRWWEIVQPAWMLGQGWAVSPDGGAAAFADRREPHQVPADGYLRRSAAPHRLMIGGRYLDGGEGALVVEIDGRPVGRWPVTPREPWFLRWIDLPAGVLDGPGPYATVTARVEPVAGASSDPPRIEIAQFDFAPADVVMAGLATGWHGAEPDDETGEVWRWSTDRLTLEVQAADHGAVLMLAGEATLRSFERPSVVTVRAGDVVVRRFDAGGDFSQVIELPAGHLSASPATVTIETDQAFVPAERGESADQRRLGLRLSRVEVGPMP